MGKNKPDSSSILLTLPNLLFQTWEAITEDQDGLMEVSVQEMIQRAKRKRLLDKSGAKTKLGMMRHFFILLDMSQNMKNQVHKFAVRFFGKLDHPELEKNVWMEIV